jgi:hypothetical protein
MSNDAELVLNGSELTPDNEEESSNDGAFSTDDSRHAPNGSQSASTEPTPPQDTEEFDSVQFVDFPSSPTPASPASQQDAGTLSATDLVPVSGLY